MAGHQCFTPTLTSKAFIVFPLLTTYAKKNRSSHEEWALSLILLLVSNKQHQHVCLSQISNGFSEVTGIPAEGETSSLKLVCKAQFEKRLVSPHPPLQLSSHWVGPSEVVGAWHRDDMDALFSSCWPER